MTILNVFWGGDSNHDYKAPGPNDLRSPCPFLNTLANHVRISPTLSSSSQSNDVCPSSSRVVRVTCKHHPTRLSNVCQFVRLLSGTLPDNSNRDGQHVTWWSTTSAIHKVYNLSWFVAGLLSLSGVFTGIVLHWNPFWFDLGILRTHKSYLVESDASLSEFFF